METGDFALTEESPCIDAGNPDDAFDDPDGTRNDMGALFYDQNSSAVDPATWSGIKRLFR